MKHASILNKNYVQYNTAVESAFDSLNEELASTFTAIESAVNALFEAEDLTTTSPEYFTFKHTPIIRDVLKEDYDNDIRNIIAANKTTKNYKLENAMKSAGLHQVLFESSSSKLELINETFGQNSVLNEECDMITAQGKEFRPETAKIIDLVEAATAKVDYIMKTLSNTADDKAALIENLEVLAAAKMFIEEMR